MACPALTKPGRLSGSDIRIDGQAASKESGLYSDIKQADPNAFGSNSIAVGMRLSFNDAM